MRPRGKYIYARPFEFSNDCVWISFEVDENKTKVANHTLEGKEGYDQSRMTLAEYFRGEGKGLGDLTYDQFLDTILGKESFYLPEVICEDGIISVDKFVRLYDGKKIQTVKEYLSDS